MVFWSSFRRGTALLLCRNAGEKQAFAEHASRALWVWRVPYGRGRHPFWSFSDSPRPPAAGAHMDGACGRS